MSAAYDIGINVIAYPITFALGSLATVCFRRFRLRGARRLWKPFLTGGKLAIILTDKPGANTPKVSVTEVQAFSDLRTALKPLGQEVELEIGSVANFQLLRQRAFISLGGPKANPATKQIISSLNLPFSFDYETLSFKTANGSNYGEEKSADGTETVVDYGVIIRLAKLIKSDASSAPAMIIFGLRGAGTQDAVHALLNETPVRECMLKYPNKNTFILLKFNKTKITLPCEIIASGTF